MKRVYNLSEYCVGCGLCEVHCATVHSEYPENIWKAHRLADKRPIARLFVERNATASLSVQCRHCDEPACVYACITGAITKESETGLVLINEDKCVGCSTCLVACPYGLIKIDPCQKVSLKCDMCKDIAQTPVCVTRCPNEALVCREEEI
jgi:carbon-monoxide dehydrogenase iron sulfur subunit